MNLFPSLLEAWLMVANLAHHFLTVLFFITFARVVFQKYSPYSQLYLAGFMTVQIAWNGCPITDFINYFNAIGMYELTENGFIWSIGGEYNQLFRLAFLIMAPFLYYNAFITWQKAPSMLDFGNFIRHGSFRMVKES